MNLTNLRPKLGVQHFVLQIETLPSTSSQSHYIKHSQNMVKYIMLHFVKASLYFPLLPPHVSSEPAGGQDSLR